MQCLTGVTHFILTFCDIIALVLTFVTHFMLFPSFNPSCAQQLEKKYKQVCCVDLVEYSTFSDFSPVHQLSRS